MKRRPIALLVIALDLVVLLALAFVFPHLMVSPGPLVKGHDELASDCFACHSPWRGAASARCIACHAVADVGVRTTKGVPIDAGAVRVAFHQQLIEQDCTACHSDHQGPRLTKRSRKPFSHALIDASVLERCSACHAAPKDTLHRDLRAECARCHERGRWKPATFDHDRFFVLDRNHRASCETCHRNHDYGRYSCYGCHEHSQAKVRAEHVEEGIRDFQDCVRCHRNPGVEPDKGGEGKGHSGGHEGRERQGGQRD